MPTTIEQFQNTLCKLLCADVRVVQRGDRLMVLTPFFFPDGDGYVLYLEERPGGIVRFSDGGHTLMHLSYEMDIDKLNEGTRERVFRQILSNYGVQEQEGEIFLETPQAELGQALFRLGQALTSIGDLSFLNRVRVESTFYDDLDKVLTRLIPSEMIQRDYVIETMANGEVYPIDYRIEGKQNQLFLFGIPNRDKARLVTVVLERLLREQLEFDSLLVFEDQKTIPRDDVARLSNAGGEMVSGLVAESDLRRKLSKKAA